MKGELDVSIVLACYNAASYVRESVRQIEDVMSTTIYRYEIMRAIIDNILMICQMRAKALSVLLDNTQKALSQQKEEEKSDERMTNGWQKAVAKLAAFTRIWTQSISSLLGRFERTQTFEEKIDNQISKLEAGVGRKSPALDENLGETEPSLTIRLVNSARRLTGGFARFLKVRRVASTAANRRRFVKSLQGLAQDIAEDSPAPAQDAYDYELEDAFQEEKIHERGWGALF